MKLLTNYTNIYANLDVICQYGHQTQIVWRTAKNYGRKKLCIECMDLERQVRVSAISNPHMDDEQLTELGNQFGWTFISRTDTSGTYQWQCASGHIVLKTKHNIKSNFCQSCDDDRAAQPDPNLTNEQLAVIAARKERKSQLQKDRKQAVREQRTLNQ
jgi:hypothetical protein